MLYCQLCGEKWDIDNSPTPTGAAVAEPTWKEQPMGATTQPIEERLALLEHRFQRWRLVTLLLVSMLGVCLLAGADRGQQIRPPTDAAGIIKAVESKQVVSATQYQLVDENGVVRAVLGTIKGGSVGLYVFDRNAEQKACLDEGGLRVLDKNGNVASLGLANGTPVVVLSKMYGRGAKLRLEPK
jgi:hypothetical protein